MSLKGTNTASTFMEWDIYKSLVNRLERDGNFKFSLLITIGVNTGLRISDILKLKKSDVLNSDFIDLIEGKTGKQRKIKLNAELKDSLERIIPKYLPGDDDSLLFINRFGTKAMDKSYVNLKFKEICKVYKVKVNGNLSTHSFRKTLGRRVVEVNNYSNESIMLLTDVFRHSNMAITKRYLGIRQDEINNVYDSLCL
ncbi:MAG: tyrosine-type recombinase/integrase [Bacteroidetes bacterium]|nr:tyrosine-type recombinase/integrase [Bacteroidota bacterium]